MNRLNSYEVDTENWASWKGQRFLSISIFLSLSSLLIYISLQMFYISPSRHAHSFSLCLSVFAFSLFSNRNSYLSIVLSIDAGVFTCRVKQHSVCGSLLFWVFWRPGRHSERGREREKNKTKTNKRERERQRELKKQQNKKIERKKGGTQREIYREIWKEEREAPKI